LCTFLPLASKIWRLNSTVPPGRPVQRSSGRLTRTPAPARGIMRRALTVAGRAGVVVVGVVVGGAVVGSTGGPGGLTAPGGTFCPPASGGAVGTALPVAATREKPPAAPRA
jgi:hypothetical protein